MYLWKNVQRDNLETADNTTLDRGIKCEKENENATLGTMKSERYDLRHETWKLIFRLRTTCCMPILVLAVRNV